VYQPVITTSGSETRILKESSTIVDDTRPIAGSKIRIEVDSTSYENASKFSGARQQRAIYHCGSGP